MDENQPTPQPGETPPGAEKYTPFRMLILILSLLGLFTILAGVISLLAALSGGVSGVLWEDVIFNVTFGGLVFLSTRMLAKRRPAGIWIFLAAILLSLGYSFFMGRGLNVVMALFGAVVGWQLFRLKQRGEIR